MVTLDDVRKLVRTEPFPQFTIVLKDGSRYFVDDMVHIAIGAPDVFFVVDLVAGGWARIEYPDIEALDSGNTLGRRAG